MHNTRGMCVLPHLDELNIEQVLQLISDIIGMNERSALEMQPLPSFFIRADRSEYCGTISSLGRMTLTIDSPQRHDSLPPSLPACGTHNRHFLLMGLLCLLSSPQVVA